MDSGLKAICPQCRQPSHSIKRLNSFFAVCIVIGAWWQGQEVTACDKCMRQHIFKNALINIVTANIIWPIIILPTSLYNLYQTYRPGHSESIQQEIYLATQQLYARTGNQSRNLPSSQESISGRLGDLSERHQWSSRNNSPNE